MFNNDLPDYVRQQSESGDGNYYVHIALQNNGQLSNEAWIMKNLACELEETLCELDGKNYKQHPQLLKRQNYVFGEFRRWLRKVYHSSIGPINVNKPNSQDYKVIKQLESYMDKPYGSFPIRNITRPALDYFHMLEVKGLVPVSFGFSQMSGINKLMKS